MSTMPDAECNECARLRNAYSLAFRNVAICEDSLNKAHASVAEYKHAVKNAEAAERQRLEALDAIEAHRAETGHKA